MTHLALKTWQNNGIRLPYLPDHSLQGEVAKERRITQANQNTRNLFRQGFDSTFQRSGQAFRPILIPYRRDFGKGLSQHFHLFSLKAAHEINLLDELGPLKSFQKPTQQRPPLIVAGELTSGTAG